MTAPRREADSFAGNAPASSASVPAASAWRAAIARRVHWLPKPFAWLLRLARIVETAVPVGMLSSDDIKHLVFEAYRNAPDFYDPDSYAIRYEDELLPLLQEHVAANGGRLLDLYCGHGREAEIFARAGFAVTGVDAQPAVIDRARTYAESIGIDVEFLVADIDNWTPRAQAWDVIYTSLWMYSTVPDRAARLAWLKRFRDWLAPQGVLVISVTPQPAGSAAGIRHGIATALSWLTFNKRRPERGDRFTKQLFWHDFADRDVRAEATSAGYSVVAALDIEGGTPCNFLLLKAADELP
ncbi:MAG: class I SAM-dependent methyltransferase [Pseudomonadota bacterium]